MPLSIAFRFPAGRYHATPFGHHVNEGLIEWPPSPWRLLRALLSVGYTAGKWDGTGPPVVVRSLIDKLSAELPHYYLPPVVATHSRHYVPIGGLSNLVEKTTMVFDAWVRLEEKQEMIVSWRGLRLSPAETSVLGCLVSYLNYLGRSESWVQGRLMQDEEEAPQANCTPGESERHSNRGWEQVPFLAAVNASDFMDWRQKQVDAALADLALPPEKKPAQALLKKRQKAIEPYPEDLLDCLQKDTNWWRGRHGWSQPPGSRKVFYWRRSDAIVIGATRKVKASFPVRAVQAILLSLTNASRNDHALPPVTRTLPQADLLHRHLVSVAAKKGAPPKVLTGCDENRRPLQGQHEHAHVFPLDLDQDGHLDHVLFWAPMLLDAEAQAAIRSMRKTFTKGGIEPLRLAVAAMGDLRDFGRMPGDYGSGIARITDSASVWQSVTPFVAPRYVKTHGKNTLEGQIKAELDSRGYPPPVNVKLLRLDQFPKFRHFKLTRNRGPQPPVACGFAVRIEFAQPVKGPIALGYGSHFGLGLLEGRCLKTESTG